MVFLAWSFLLFIAQELIYLLMMPCCWFKVILVHLVVIVSGAGWIVILGLLLVVIIPVIGSGIVLLLLETHIISTQLVRNLLWYDFILTYDIWATKLIMDCMNNGLVFLNKLLAIHLSHVLLHQLLFVLLLLQLLLV